MKFSSVLPLAAAIGTTLASNVTVANPSEPFVPGNQLPPSHATTDGASIVQLFPNLGRSTTWNLVQKTPFQGDTGEPEGMVRVGDDRYFVAAGQWTVPTVKYGRWINGTDRTNGEGYAHMLIYDGQGGLIANATLTQPGAMEYHIGGVDYDSQYIWATLSQYRPNSTATIIKIEPRTLNYTSMFRTDDHNGGIVHDTVTNSLSTLNWGGRNETTWSLRGYPQNFTPLPGFTPAQSSHPDPSWYVDYQDCKFLGHQQLPNNVAAQFGRNAIRPVMFCSGVASIGSFNLGGIALVDIPTMTPIWEVPISMVSDLGAPVTQNPTDVAVVNNKLRIYCLPDQHNSTLYVYEAE